MALALQTRVVHQCSWCCVLFMSQGPAPSNQRLDHLDGEVRGGCFKPRTELPYWCSVGVDVAARRGGCLRHMLDACAPGSGQGAADRMSQGGNVGQVQWLMPWPVEHVTQPDGNGTVN